MKLKLYRPLKQMMISQNFGENNACIRTDGVGNIIPRTAPNCPIGYLSVYKYFGMKGHNGLDFPAVDWQPVYATLEGIVDELQTEPSRGLGVGIVSEQEYDWEDAFSNAKGTNNIKHRYWHLAGMNVKIGDRIKVGDVIGWADNTGYSTGTHLHYEIKPVKNGVNILQDNGMFGAIDPLVYLQKISAFEKQDFLAKIFLQLADIASQVQDLFLKAGKK